MPLAGTLDAEQTADWARAKDSQWDANGYGPWALLINGQFAGWGGFEREEDAADFALVLLPRYWGHGAQITRLALQRGFDELGIEEVTIALPYTCSPEKVLARFGFIPNGEVSYGDTTFRRYRVTKDRWLAAH
jgi:ribosomal-protein-alanine N-acetyltransferase